MEAAAIPGLYLLELQKQPLNCGVLVATDLVQDAVNVQELCLLADLTQLRQ
jgi:hypothetical protein